MAKKKYLIDNDPAKELIIRWNSGWRQTEVIWNQQEIAVFDKNQLLNRANVELPESGTLELHLEKGLFASLNSRINGKHIPNSMGDPQYTFRQIFILLLVLGIINMGIGIALAMLASDEDVNQLGIVNAALGILQIIIGYGILRNFFPALIVAVAFMGADLVLTAMYSGGNAISGAVMMKVFFLIFMLRGFKAFKEKRIIEEHEKMG